jgi:hypothetical protein
VIVTAVLPNPDISQSQRRSQSLQTQQRQSVAALALKRNFGAAIPKRMALTFATRGTMETGCNVRV